MPRDDPEFDGLTKTGNFNFFKILLIIKLNYNYVKNLC